MSLKEIIIGITIAILMVLTITYGVNIIYEKPEYNDFCPDVYRINNQSACEDTGGIWINNSNMEDNVPVRGGNCQKPNECSEEYNKAREEYSRNLFLITLPLGILIIATGAIIFGLEFIGAGLMGGGILTILFGVMSYWRHSDDILKFLLSLSGLIIIIGVGYWINNKTKK